MEAEKTKKTRNRKKIEKKFFSIGIPTPLADRLQDYVDNINQETTMTNVIIAGLETELNKRYSEIFAYERTQAGKHKEAPMNIETKSANTGRKKSAGPLGTLAASHCPVNGPALPEGGNIS